MTSIGTENNIHSSMYSCSLYIYSLFRSLQDSVVARGFGLDTQCLHRQPVGILQQNASNPYLLLNDPNVALDKSVFSRAK